MAAKGEDPEVLRLVVLFLRNHVGLSQAELGRAAGVRQSYLSGLESGHKSPSEEVLQRLAAAAGVPWPLLTQLRSFYAAFLAAIRTEGTLETGGALPAPGLGEPASLAVRSYWIETAAAARDHDEVSEAERTWKAIAHLPHARRSRAVEVSPRASKNGELARLLCAESERVAADQPSEALHLADLALRIAKRVEGGEPWRSRLSGYVLAFKGNALRVAGHLDRATEAFLLGWELWKAGANAGSSPLPEWRMLLLEASLRREERRFQEALKLLARAEEESRGDSTALAAIHGKKELLLREQPSGS